MSTLCLLRYSSHCLSLLVYVYVYVYVYVSLCHLYLSIYIWISLQDASKIDNQIDPIVFHLDFQLLPDGQKRDKFLLPMIDNMKTNIFTEVSQLDWPVKAKMQIKLLRWTFACVVV